MDWKDMDGHKEIQLVQSYNCIALCKLCRKNWLSSVPEESTEKTNQLINQQPPLIGLAGEQANQTVAATFTLAPNSR